MIPTLKVTGQRSLAISCDSKGVVVRVHPPFQRLDLQLFEMRWQRRIEVIVGDTKEAAVPISCLCACGETYYARMVSVFLIRRWCTDSLNKNRLPSSSGTNRLGE